jgi:hypothetical protein
MTLSALIQKGGIEHLANANPAKVANDGCTTDQALAGLAALALANPPEPEPKQERGAILTAACADLPIPPEQVTAALAPEELAALKAGRLSADALAAFARALVSRRAMDAGECPAHYTAAAVCRHCGPVWTWANDGKDTARSAPLAGCPWCWNRLEGLPIPRPEPMPCAGCRHFMRSEHHPHLGHCGAGEPEAAAGLWGSDPRHCLRWLPAVGA